LSTEGVWVASEEELETQERFRLWYELESETLVEIEREVIGSTSPARLLVAARKRR
jgi:hypothetical protein